MKEAKRSSRAFGKYREVIKLLTESNDRTGLNFVQDLVNKCSRYFEIMKIIEEARNPERRYRKDIPQIPLERLSVMESMRGTAHNEVIRALHKVNDYLFENYGRKAPGGGIYYLNIDKQKLAKLDRGEIAKWVELLVSALYKEGILRR